jgi:hypothetical protein
MKNLITTAIAVFVITGSFAKNTNPSAAVSLTASVNNNTVVLKFMANSNFQVERSFYSNEFVTIASINIPGNTVSNFRINDDAAELAGRKMAYYRVRMIAADGAVRYSNVMVVSLHNTEAAVANTASVKFNATQNGNAVITIQNAAGKTVAVKNVIASKGDNMVEVAGGLAKGFYTAAVSVNGVLVTTEKIIAE